MVPANLSSFLSHQTLPTINSLAILNFSNRQFSCSAVSSSLQPHGPPCPSPTPRACKLLSIKSVMPSNHLILCRPLILLLPIFPSIRVFSKVSVLHIRWPKYWSFSFIISPSNNSGLISFRIYWFDPLADQRTLKSLLQYHSSKTSILQHSAFFIVQLSHPYMTTGKTIALTGWTSLGKAMSLLFNFLSRFVTAFLPRSKHLLISCWISHHLPIMPCSLINHFLVQKFHKWLVNANHPSRPLLNVASSVKTFLLPQEEHFLSLRSYLTLCCTLIIIWILSYPTCRLILSESTIRFWLT